MTRLRLFWSICLLLIAVGGFAQKKEKEKTSKQAKEKDKKNTNVMLKSFEADKKQSTLVVPKLTFKNINIIPYYRDPHKLAVIQRLEKNKQWEEMYIALFDYVTHFGIDNFIKDIDLLWKLARVSEYLKQDEFTKEVYRLLIKHFRGDLQQAIYHYEKLNPFDKPLYVELDYYYEMVEKRKLIDTLKPPQDVMLNMGSDINSPYDDYGMTITGENDDILLFTSKRTRIDVSHSDLENNQNEDIFISYKDEYGYWTEPSPLNGINSPYNEGSPCMSADGKYIIFSRCGDPHSYGNCDLYSSYLIANNEGKLQWSEPINLGNNVNSYAWDSHPALSPGGDTLYFASDRRGGFGGTDLYYSVKTLAGQWGKARNMGPVVNTRASEVSPFPHPVNNVLYFSSNGHIINFGSFDIFKTYQKNGQWVEPLNVGPLVNGKGSEFYFAIDTKAKWLFYARSEMANVAHHHDENLDLHSFPLPMEAQPNAIVRFSGKVQEPVTGEVFTGTVTVIDLEEGIEVMPKYMRDDGTFEFDLIDKRRYMLVIEGDNFFKIEELFYLNGDTTAEIPAVSMNTSLAFKSIDFETGSAKLAAGMENNLHLVIEFLQKHPKFNVTVIGHTDSDGNHDFNMKLSQKRAEVIREYILDYGGFDTSRVQALGVGDTQPIIAKPKTEEQKKLNRRVEFKIFKRDEYDDLLHKKASEPAEEPQEKDEVDEPSIPDEP